MSASSPNANHDTTLEQEEPAMLRFFTLFFSLILTNCGAYTDSTKSPRSSDLSAAKDSVLIFSGTDIKFESSTLYALNTESEELTTILGGQSSDMLVRTAGDR